MEVRSSFLKLTRAIFTKSSNNSPTVPGTRKSTLQMALDTTVCKEWLNPFMSSCFLFALTTRNLGFRSSHIFRRSPKTALLILATRSQGLGERKRWEQRLAVLKTVSGPQTRSASCLLQRVCLQSSVSAWSSSPNPFFPSHCPAPRTVSPGVPVPSMWAPLEEASHLDVVGGITTPLLRAAQAITTFQSKSPRGEDARHQQHHWAREDNGITYLRVEISGSERDKHGDAIDRDALRRQTEWAERRNRIDFCKSA